MVGPKSLRSDSPPSTRRSSIRAVVLLFFVSGMLVGGGVVRLRAQRTERRLNAELTKARTETERHRQTAQIGVTEENDSAPARTLYRDCPSWPPPSSKPIVKIEARVVRYDAIANVVQIDRGSDAGAFLGQEIDIVRDNHFICSILLDHVGRNFAIGHIGRVKVPDREPKIGDLATNL